MKVAALFSGGKDSAYAIYIAQQWGWEVDHLITIIPEKGESYMFHVPNISLTDQLSECLGIPLSKAMTGGEEEVELNDLKELLASMDISGLITGAIASDYQTSRINRVCHDLGIKVFSPLWRKSQSMLLRDMLNSGFKIMIIGVYAEGLGEDWLGRILDDGALDELEEISARYKINVAGEGGEFESLTLDGPIFERPVILEKSRKEWDGTRGILRVEKAVLGPQNRKV